MVAAPFMVVSAVLSIAAAMAAAEPPVPAAPATQPSVVRFRAGGWDPSRWEPVRLANQARPVPLAQLVGAIGAAPSTFTAEDYRRETDNAIALYDLGSAEAEVTVEFTIGRGFGGTAAPGLCIAPRVEGGVVRSSLAVFVADYAMAVWYQDTAADGKTVRYRHLLQLARRSEPDRPHVLRCRISAKERSVALKVDDSDVAVLTFVGNPGLSLVPLEINSLVGLWACHGECAFREMSADYPGSLPFIVRAPANPKRR